jgi:predicted RND superfamily exporter protein
MNEVIVGERAVPETAKLASQLLLLADGSGLDALVLKPGAARGRVLLQLPDLGGRHLLALANELQAFVDVAYEGLEVSAQVNSLSYVAYRGLQRLSGELALSLLSAFFIIAVTLALLFGSLRVALLSLVPNGLPLLAALGAMGALGWDLNPTTGVVFTVALGIAVDDTIHMLARMREGLRDGLRGDDVLYLAVRRTGRALFITSVILGIGFGLNALSTFRINRWFGVLGAFAIATAFFLDVLVLPALLKLFGPPSIRQGAGAPPPPPPPSLSRDEDP